MIVDDNNIVISCHRCRDWTGITLGAMAPDGRRETTCKCGTLGLIGGVVRETAEPIASRQPVRYTRPRPC